MKRTLPGLALMVLGITGLRAATAPIYINTGTVTNDPQVDAVAFANYGSFDVGTTLPFETQNTLYYTNRGSMTGSPGFDFHYFHYTNGVGIVQTADTFVNGNGASITAGGGGIIFFPGLGGAESPAIRITATNVVNSGLLSVGSSGLIQLTGGQMDLSRSGLEIQPLMPPAAGGCIQGGLFNISDVDFFPDDGITDQGWDLTNGFMNLQNDLVPQVDPVTGKIRSISIPGFQMIQPCYVTNFFGGFTILGSSAYVYTNSPTPSNRVIQAVFVVNSSDTNVTANVRFSPSPNPAIPFTTPIVGLTFIETNIVTGATFPNTLYLMDALATSTNYVLLTNLASSCPTFMPANYVVSRSEPCEFETARPPNGTITNNLFYDQTMTNSAVTNFYADYYVNVDSGITATAVGTDLTELPGRVQIDANNLDLSRARIRGESVISVKTRNLVNSEGANLDCSTLSYDLASTNGTLVLQSLAKREVERFTGQLFAWSAIWTNYTGSVDTNPPVPPDTNSVLVTNVIELDYHVLVVDGFMQTTLPVSLADLRARATNIVLSDDVNASGIAQFTCQNFTLRSNLFLGSETRNWDSISAPGVRFFTNYGTLSVPNSANLGADRPAPYDEIDNRGTIRAFDATLRALQFDDSGTVSATAGIVLATQNGKLDSGQFVAGGDITLGGWDIKCRQFQNVAVGALALNVTNSLTDSGGGANNIWTVGDGFRLVQKPAIGELLGTTFRTRAPKFANVFHQWAALDRGVSAAGYSNNVAIGRLTLDTDFDARLTFAGTGSSNGLYVDFLELSTNVSSDLVGTVGIAPNLVIYFADSNVPVEQLDGALNGHLRWVRDFAGPNSSVDVLLLNGTTITVNRALRFSNTIDSDGDGVPNAQDFYPFDGAAWNEVSFATVNGRREVTLSWRGAAQTTYVIESTTNLTAPNWQPLLTYTNLALTNGILSITDRSVSAGDLQRYYRVGYTP